MLTPKKIYAVLKTYTDESIAGGGAIKGKNCVIQSISDITGGHRVTFQWTLDDDTEQTGTMDVMDGSGAEAIEQIYADNGILGAKNLLNNTATTQTINDVTFTVNDDGTVIANGQASANASLVVWDDLLHLEEGSYIFTGCPAGGSAETYSMMVQDEPLTTTKFETGNGLVLDVPAGGKDYHFYYARIVSGYNAQNLVFKPMLRLATDTDSTYVPYAMTNRELTEKIANFGGVILSSADDMNNQRPTGIYPFTTAPINSPEGLTYGTLINIINANANEQQYVLKGASNVMYMRSLTTASPRTWGSWYKFTGTVVS